MISTLYEHLHGVPDLDDGIRYWAQFGFREVARGGLSATDADALYGVRSALVSARLEHQASSPQAKTEGVIRLMQWETPLGEGLGLARPLALGSRWLACFTRDLLQLRAGYEDEAAVTGAPLWMTPIVRLHSKITIVERPGFYTPFVGEFETFLITPLNRHAFLQFSRIPAATDDLFAPDATYSVSIPRHGDMVIGDLAHIDFYVNGLGLESRGAPSFNDWTDTATRDALDMREGETFSVVGLRAPGSASGLLRVYVVHTPTDDARAVSRPGHLGLCCFSYRFGAGALAAVRERVAAHGAADVSAVVPNEFGEPALTFTAPDGIAWTVHEAS